MNVAWHHLFTGLLFAITGCRVPQPTNHSPTSGSRTPEQRAVTFLANEVPRWPRENQCFSCHNNGDAARALYVAARMGYSVPKESLRETTAWLKKPDQWDNNKGNPAFSDKRLARIQFTAALASAVEARQIADSPVQHTAAQKLIDEQHADGAWHIEPDGTLGSPATYGTTLATVLGVNALTKLAPGAFSPKTEVGEHTRPRVSLDPPRVQHSEAFESNNALETVERFKFSARARKTAPGAGALPGSTSLFRLSESRRKAEHWLRQQTLQNNVLDAAAMLIGPRSSKDVEAAIQQQKCLDLLRRAQKSDGGWGPYVDAPPEAFDTAVVLLAIMEIPKQSGIRQIIERGRNFLLATQLTDGSWPETTRPPGGQSYAQHISTTAWATLALLRTAPQ